MMVPGSCRRSVRADGCQGALRGQGPGARGRVARRLGTRGQGLGALWLLSWIQCAVAFIMDSMRRGFYHGFNAMWLLSWIQCAVAFQVRRGFPGAPWLSRCAVAFQVRRGMGHGARSQAQNFGVPENPSIWR